MKTAYETETVVECTDNGKCIVADVFNFQHGVYLSVVMNTVQVNLQYNKKFDQYQGSMGGLELISKGPKAIGSYR